MHNVLKSNFHSLQLYFCVLNFIHSCTCVYTLAQILHWDQTCIYICIPVIKPILSQCTSQIIKVSLSSHSILPLQIKSIEWLENILDLYLARSRMLKPCQVRF